MSHRKDSAAAKDLPLKIEGHKKPVTRRDFLSRGMISGTGWVITPSLLGSFVSQRAFGLECGAAKPGVSSSLPVLIFDLSGGANITGGNVMVGKQGGQKDYLANYSSLGVPASMAPQNGNINEQLGLVFHSDSGFLRGILETSSVETRAKIEGALFCTSSNDDTGNNPHNPMYWLAKAGARGELTNLVGTESSISGGRSMPPAASIDPALRPVRVGDPSAALNLVNPGKLAQLLSGPDVEKILRATHRMSASRLARFQAQDMPTQIKELVECGYLNSIDLLTKNSPQSVDPRQDPIVSELFALNNGDEGKIGSLAKLLLDGYVGAATFEKGGYDYHDSTRSSGENRDRDAGRLMGKALELAARKQRDLLIYVFTDGGVSSSGRIDDSADGRGKGVWSGDSGDRSGSFMLLYKAEGEGRPGLRVAGRRQVGYYADNTSSNNRQATKISSSVDNLAKAVVANYLALHGREGQLAQIVGDNPFAANELEQYLIFNKMRS
ncbi:MAG: hypothetical protein KBD78_07195 [Oligoflexales bacterium]|nr:hypothetical protein [Oligoflexales bacterium]